MLLQMPERLRGPPNGTGVVILLSTHRGGRKGGNKPPSSDTIVSEYSQQPP